MKTVHKIFTRKKLGYSLLFVLALGLFGCVQMGLMVGKLLTGKTSDLSVVSCQVRYITNLYTPETQTTEAKYMPELWKEGVNTVVVNFFKREGIGMLQIDGKVIIDGTEVPHIANGVYSKPLEKGDTSPKKVRVETVSGQSFELEIGPATPIKILSVNGKKEGAEINMNKDLVLELDNPAGSEESEIRLALLADILGTRSFPDLAVFKTANKLEIPAAVFNNPGSSMPPNSGPNYLLVERFDVKTATPPGVGALQVISQAWDCVPVTVSGEVDKNLFGTSSNYGINIQKEYKNDAGNLKLQMTKPNAFLGRPFSSGKKFAVVSYSVRATRLQQSQTTTSSSTTGNIRTTTTTTTTRTFPTLPDEFWDNLVNGLYADFESILKENFNMELIPIEDVLKAKSYKDLEPIADTVTIVEVEKSYQGTKNLIPTTLSAIVDNISTTFASDRIDSRLIEELGVDGIIAVTLDLAMPWEEFTLKPRMSIRISGGPNGYTAGPTIYAQGTIEGNGIPLDKAKMDASHVMEVLPKVIRQADLKAALSEGLKELHAQEKEKDYEALWALKGPIYSAQAPAPSLDEAQEGMEEPPAEGSQEPETTEGSEETPAE